MSLGDRRVRDANEYGHVAHLYDAYVRVDFDLDFFRQRAAQHAGPVLELMAGTGRVSRVIQHVTPRLTCVDISLPMLRILQRNLGDVVPAPQVICADIRSLPLPTNRYGLAVIPFNSFAELTTLADQRKALNEARRVLRPGGQFICTLHNPPVRVQSLDGQTRLIGTHDLPPDRRLEVWVRGSIDPATGVARSTQTFCVYDSRGELEGQELQEVRFALITSDSFRGLAYAVGFRVLEVLGDYDGCEYTEDSPYMIWTLEKVEGAA